MMKLITSSRSDRPTRRLLRSDELKPLLQRKTFIASPTRRRLERAQTVSDLARIARSRTPRAVFDYVAGAADDEIGLQRSQDAYRRVEFTPSVLRDVTTVDTSTTILGRPASLPLIFAPTGFTRMMHHSGEIAVGRAAAAAGIPFALSTMGTTSIEGLTAAVGGGDNWFQLYLWKDRAASAALVDRARTAGVETIVLTVDTPIAGTVGET